MIRLGSRACVVKTFSRFDMLRAVGAPLRALLLGLRAYRAPTPGPAGNLVVGRAGLLGPAVYFGT